MDWLRANGGVESLSDRRKDRIAELQLQMIARYVRACSASDF